MTQNALTVFVCKDKEGQVRHFITQPMRDEDAALLRHHVANSCDVVVVDEMPLSEYLGDSIIELCTV